LFGYQIRRITVAAVTTVAGIGLLGGVALAWSGSVQGKPASFHAGATDGYYIWHSDDGWHLRTTDSSGTNEYTGVVRTNGTFYDVRLVRAEHDDHLAVVDEGEAIVFRFRTSEGIDGLDFRIRGGTGVRFNLKENGAEIAPANIFVGEDSVHPATDPFEALRDPDGPSPLAPTTGATPAPTVTPGG
jgi:hypothetical protein